MGQKRSCGNDSWNRKVPNQFPFSCALSRTSYGTIYGTEATTSYYFVSYYDAIVCYLLHYTCTRLPWRRVCVSQYLDKIRIFVEITNYTNTVTLHLACHPYKSQKIHPFGDFVHRSVVCSEQGAVQRDLIILPYCNYCNTKEPRMCRDTKEYFWFVLLHVMNRYFKLFNGYWLFQSWYSETLWSTACTISSEIIPWRCLEIWMETIVSLCETAYISCAWECGIQTENDLQYNQAKLDNCQFNLTS